MKDALPKVRENNVYTRSSPVIDYRCADYDIEQVNSGYTALSAELAKAQTELDYENSTVEFDVVI